MKMIKNLIMIVILVYSNYLYANDTCPGTVQNMEDEMIEKLENPYKAVTRYMNNPDLRTIQTPEQLDNYILDDLKCVTWSDGVNRYTGNRLPPITFKQRIDLHIFESSKIRILDGYKRVDERAPLDESFLGSSVFGDFVRVSRKRINNDEVELYIEVHMCELYIADHYDGSRTYTDYNEAKVLRLDDQAILDSAYYNESDFGQIDIMNFTINATLSGREVPIITTVFGLEDWLYKGLKVADEETEGHSDIGEEIDAIGEKVASVVKQVEEIEKELEDLMEKSEREINEIMKDLNSY